MNTKERI